MLTGVIPCPCQMTDIRSNSVSKHPQQSFPRFKIIPRGVRLFAGHSFPRFLASRHDPKKGKSFSTKELQAFVFSLKSTESGEAPSHIRAANAKIKMLDNNLSAI